MTAVCKFEGCTVSETGRCALEQDAKTCSNRIVEISVPGPDSERDSNTAVNSSEDIGSPVLEAPKDKPSFPPSTTLGLEFISEMMVSKYINIVGILGDPESGKTAALASLYLLISTAKLHGWSFADSRSLMGFEEISRGSREWNAGNLPEQMTVHTRMADERRPGFLHFRLKRNVDNRCVDLVLPDIPGEWTKDLIRTSRTDRLQFMKSADVIWLVVDGRKLINKVQRQGEIIRLGQLVGRLRTLMDGARLPRLLLVLTHHDAGIVPSDVTDKVHVEMERHGITLEVIPIASFSENVEIKAGSGLSDLINSTVSGNAKTAEFWPSSHLSVRRSYLKYRGDQ